MARLQSIMHCKMAKYIPHQIFVTSKYVEHPCTLLMDLFGLMDMSKTWESDVFPRLHLTTVGLSPQQHWLFFFFFPLPPGVYLPRSLDLSPTQSGSQRAVTGMGKYGRRKPLYFCILQSSKL